MKVSASKGVKKAFNTDIDQEIEESSISGSLALLQTWWCHTAGSFFAVH
jgi:hypothetical protein